MSALQRLVEECPRRAGALSHIGSLWHHRGPDGRICCSFLDAPIPDGYDTPTLAQFDHWNPSHDQSEPK